MSTVKISSHLAGKSLEDSFIRQETGCNVLSIKTGDDQIINPEPDLGIPAESELVLGGTTEDEKKFMNLFRE